MPAESVVACSHTFCHNRACLLTAFGVRQVRPDEVLFMYGGSYRPKGNRMQLIKVDRERRAAWPIPISARHLPGALVFLMA